MAQWLGRPAKIRSIIQGGAEPAPRTWRAAALQVVRECVATYGLALLLSLYNTCRERTSVMSMLVVDGSQP